MIAPARLLTALALAAAPAGFLFVPAQEPAACCDGEATLVAGVPAAQDGPTLDDVKALLGDWYQAGADGEATGTLAATLRVTAGGSAVVETLFPGTDHEMLSVYHMDGGDLVMTHYCVLGNAPSYRARRTDDGLHWQCTGVANLHAHGGTHMHEGFSDRLGPNRIRAKWLQTTDGEVSAEVAMELVRVAQDG